MRYRRLGRTEMMVSEVGFGALAIGGLGWSGPSAGLRTGVDDESSLAALRRALELGVNFFDTADIYGRGHSEELIARAFAGRRANVIIATKVGMDFYRGEPVRANFGAAYIRSALVKSLARLATDYVDVYQLHNPPQKLAKDDAVWQTLADLKAEGKLRFCGVSVRTVNDALAYMRAAEADGDPRRYGDTLQLPYNLLDQEAAAKGAFVEAFRQDWGVISRVPLASGALSGRYGAAHRFPPSDFRAAWSPQRLAETARKVEALRFLEREGRTMAESALAFVLSQEAVSTAIAGARTAAQVEENARASDAAPLPDEDLRHAQSLYENDFRGSATTA